MRHNFLFRVAFRTFHFIPKHLGPLKLGYGEMMTIAFMLLNFLLMKQFFTCTRNDQQKDNLNQKKIKGVTTLIGLFVDDVDTVINKALQAGATLLSPAQNYDYGYRQGNIQDPFGHQWIIEMKI